MSTNSEEGAVGLWRKKKRLRDAAEPMTSRPTEGDVTLTTAIEVASVKAQAQAMIRRLKAALDDIYGNVADLETVVDKMPEEASNDDLSGP